VITEDFEARLWRVRRRGAWIDALLQPEDAGWSLQFTRNGKEMVTLQFPDRAQAATAAQARLREFQRAGWTEHW
jgi:hypothetical protein